MSEYVKSQFEERNMEGDIIVKGVIEGKTELPFWKHDLKLQAVISLLSTVDKKDFYESGKEDLMEEMLNEIEEIIERIRF